MHMIARSACIPPPIQLADYRDVLADTADRSASLQVNFTSLPAGCQTVRCLRAQFDEPGGGMLPAPRCGAMSSPKCSSFAGSPAIGD